MEAIKVLLVEDVALAAKMSEIVLSKLGCNITVAMTGMEAVSKFKEDYFDVVFMDLGLPDIDGLTATENIRKFEKENDRKQIPIVALTAHTSNGCRQSTLKAGMNDFLSKPLTENNAREIINRYVNSHVQL